MKLTPEQEQVRKVREAEREFRAAARLTWEAHEAWLASCRDDVPAAERTLRKREWTRHLKAFDKRRLWLLREAGEQPRTLSLHLLRRAWTIDWHHRFAHFRFEEE